MKFLQPSSDKENTPIQLGQKLKAQLELAITPGYEHNAKFFKVDISHQYIHKPFKKLDNISLSNIFRLGFIKTLLGSSLKMNDAFYI